VSRKKLLPAVGGSESGSEFEPDKTTSSSDSMSSDNELNISSGSSSSASSSHSTVKVGTDKNIDIVPTMVSPVENDQFAVFMTPDTKEFEAFPRK
jgi:hypothetical protein